MGVLLQPVHPSVAHSVLELLFLPPEHFLGQEGVFGGVERFAQDVLLDHFGLVLVHHLEAGADLVHDQLQELGVQEGHAGFDAPGHHDFVGAQAVEEVQPAQFALGFGEEFAGVGGFVEVELAAEDFVGALAAEHELDVVAGNTFGHEVHGCAGAHSVVLGLQMENDVLQEHEPFLHAELEGVVVGLDEVCHLLRSLDVG